MFRSEERQKMRFKKKKRKEKSVIEIEEQTSKYLGGSAIKRESWYKKDVTDQAVRQKY